MDAGITGLKIEDLHKIRQIALLFPEIKDVVIFGSRSLGNYKKGSDIDICLQGDRVNYQVCIRYKIQLEETNIPYFFDIVNYNTLNNLALKEHIEKFGISLNSMLSSVNSV